MLATPVITHDAPSSGLRPINLAKDTRQVVELLNLTFGNRGQRRLGERISLNYASSITMRWNMLSRGFSPGFVWEESGKIVGNLTLLESQLTGRFLIANVAVHPDYQRRGVARSLMQEATNYIVQNRGHKILLQVERDNLPAINLYHSLGFVAIGTMNHWYVAPSRLKIETPINPIHPDIRQLERGDWQEAYQLDRRVVPPDLNWPVPPSPDLFKTGIWRRLTDFLNGQGVDCWVADRQLDEFGKQRINGLVTLFREWGRPHLLRLRVDSAWQDQLEPALLYKALVKVKKLRTASAIVIHPTNDGTANKILIGANFQLRRELTIMTHDLPGYHES
ncbi:MAG TPA: GNAT family N-acetyltransferase [Patescibacteria group bacterium]|nr:GNAT family N-acetyltransferase [Patescibacteria group bacterium]